MLRFRTLITYALLAAAFAGVCHVDAVGSPGGMFDPFRKWTVTQRLRDNGFGQSFYNFSDSMHISGRYAVTCSMSANRGMGRCLVWFDAGPGMKNIAIVTDIAGQIGDQFGYKCLLFRRLGAMHLAITALSKKSDGAVLVFRQQSSSPSALWNLQQTLTPPNNDGTYASNFGRQLAFDGYAIIIGAVARYQFSQRYVISATNIRGTNVFFESTGTGAIPGDPIFTYATSAGRGNSTTLSYHQSFRGAAYTYDFGASMALSPDGNTLAVGASFRPQALFGYGTDGDLVVTGIKLLDGTASYNFNSVTIMPGGTLTVDPYDPLRGAGGILQMAIKTTLTIYPGGVINLTAHGFSGAASRSEGSVVTNGYGPGGGKSSTSIFVGDTACQYNDGSLSGVAISSTGAKRNQTSTLAYAEANGGGGGYGTPGQPGTAVQCGSSGKGGVVNGDPYVADLQRGSGGGAGQPWSVGSGGAGGAGGGAIYIACPTIINNGIITADGGDGSAGSFYSGGGGGGSGGSIYLRGLKFVNGGYVFARGGKGGFRSMSSGSTGSSSVAGGAGGVGRIRFDILSTPTHGVVNPKPLNNTGYSGDVYIFCKNLTNQSWSLRTTVPRIKSMRYTGHAVALSNSQIALASDDDDPSNPTQSIFLISLGVIKNSSSSFVGQYRQIMAPRPAVDRQFGYGLALFNNTLVASAYGNAVSAGTLYMLSGLNLLKKTDIVMSLTSNLNYPGNAFAQNFAYEYPQVLMQVPFDQDDLFSSARMSKGCVQLVKHVTNISAVRSSVTCQYTRATANTSITCTFNARDLRGIPTGDVNDLALITYPSGVSYISKGSYSFSVYLRQPGSWPVYVMHKGRRINGPSITVTKPILPWITNMTCSPLNPNGGDTVTCTIEAYNSAGEASAAPYFRATVYHTDDILLQTVATDQLTAYGTYRTPPSTYIVAPVNATDYPTVSPTVSFVSIGYYKFSFTAWRPGQMAAFVQYQNAPLAFPNPVVLDVRDPVISATASSVVCPAIAAPNRTLICTLTLLSAAHVPTSNAQLALNYSSAGRYVRATLTSPSGVVTKLTINSLWAQEGRISLLVFPTQNGTVMFAAEYNKVAIPMSPPAGVSISSNFAMTCVKMSSLLTSFTILNQQAMGKADATRWGTGATLARYVEGSGMCDNGYV